MHVHVCMHVRGETDLMCKRRKECILYLFRNMHPNKGEVNVSVVSHIKHEALNNIERALLSPPQIVH